MAISMAKKLRDEFNPEALASLSEKDKEFWSKFYYQNIDKEDKECSPKILQVFKQAQKKGLLFSHVAEVKEEPSQKEFKKDSEDIFITAIIKELITQNKIGTDEVLDSDFHNSLREAWRNGK